MADLVVPGKKPTKDKCDSCGRDPPACVIYDPNRFLDGDDEESTWDVCEECRKFISEGYEQP